MMVIRSTGTPRPIRRGRIAEGNCRRDRASQAMPLIELNTFIAAPAERVFDLSRSIELHTDSTSRTGERAIGGVTAGLIGAGQEVTWRARHFGVWQSLTVRITAFHRPTHFADAMVRG